MVTIILGTGFEEMEAICPCDILRRGGVEVQFAGIGSRSIRGGKGITVEADCTVEEVALDQLEMIVLPGGLGGVASILDSEHTLDLVRWAYKHDRYVAAICAAPSILAKLGITDGKQAVVYPGMENEMGSARMQNAGAVADGKVLTGRAAGSAMEFGLLLLETLKGPDAAQAVANGIVFAR